MNSKRITRLVPLFALMAGCSETPAQPEPAAPAAATEIEQALTDLDIGKGVAAARATLEARLAGGALARDDRARVDVALAKHLEATDRERAVALLEDASSLEDAEAQKLLFRLLSGNAPPEPWKRRGNDAPPPPSAFAFARYFPAAKGELKVEVPVVVIGASSSPSADVGAFHVAAALRQNAFDACGLCDEVKTSIHTSIHHTPLWSAIPQFAATMERALVALYVDAETIPPERYAEWLAVSPAAARAAIDRGEGLIAVKERSSAPPLVTLVAPRASQFLTVESALAVMDELPKAPVVVKLHSGLSNDEIQHGVRAQFGAFRSCYENLTRRRAGARGMVTASFTVLASGKLEDVRLDMAPSLDDAEFRACFEGGVARIVYPAWSMDPKAKTTVRYPVVLEP